MAIMAKMWGLCMLWLQWTKTNILVAKRPQTDTLRLSYGRYKIFCSYPSPKFQMGGCRLKMHETPILFDFLLREGFQKKKNYFHGIFHGGVPPPLPRPPPVENN